MPSWAVIAVADLLDRGQAFIHTLDVRAHTPAVPAPRRLGQGGKAAPYREAEQSFPEHRAWVQNGTRPRSSNPWGRDPASAWSSASRFGTGVEFCDIGRSVSR